jgi:uncharacterized cupredoxin-like copper-binding protein
MVAAFRLRCAIPVALLVAVATGGCGGTAGSATATASQRPGTSFDPREVVLVTRDWTFEPDVLDVVPGETVLLQVLNGGLETHEAIIGDDAVQDAWEEAEAAAPPGPPGVLPSVGVDPSVAGLRVVVGSGQRVDVVWEVPADPAAVRALLLGCHIADHWERGMLGDIRVAGEGEGAGLGPERAWCTLSSACERSALRPSIVATEPRGGTDDVCDHRAVHRRP